MSSPPWLTSDRGHQWAGWSGFEPWTNRQGRYLFSWAIGLQQADAVQLLLERRTVWLLLTLQHLQDELESSSEEPMKWTHSAHSIQMKGLICSLSLIAVVHLFYNIANRIYITDDKIIVFFFWPLLHKVTPNPIKPLSDRPFNYTLVTILAN